MRKDWCWKSISLIVRWQLHNCLCLYCRACVISHKQKLCRGKKMGLIWRESRETEERIKREKKQRQRETNGEWDKQSIRIWRANRTRTRMTVRDESREQSKDVNFSSLCHPFPLVWVSPHPNSCFISVPAQCGRCAMVWAVRGSR